MTGWLIATNCDGTRKPKENHGRGGGEGNDCVRVAHVDDLTEADWQKLRLNRVHVRAGVKVLIMDDRDGVCQFTLDEWLVFEAGVTKGDFHKIGFRVAAPAGDTEDVGDAPRIADGAHADYLADPESEANTSV